MQRNYIRKSITWVLILSMLLVLLGGWGSFESSYAATQQPKATAKVNSSNGVYLRAKASADSNSVKLLKNNASLTINKEVFIKKNNNKAKYRWYYVTSGDKNGYIRADLVDTIKYQSAKGKTTDALNYRKAMSSSATIKGTLKKNASVTLLLSGNLKGNSSKWYKIEKGGDYYYISSKYVKITDDTASVKTETKTSTKTETKTSTKTEAKTETKTEAKTETKTEAKTETKTETKTTTTKTPTKPTFTLSDVTYPSTINQGVSFALKGHIDCNMTIEKAVFGVTSTADKWVLSTTKNVDSETFNIATVDSAIKFGTLKPGKYVYKGVVYVNGKAYTEVKKEFTVKEVSGPKLLANTAISLAWPLGTSSTKYVYGGGGPTAQYDAALDVAYPIRLTWNKYARVGASCDVFVGTICRSCGYDKDVPRTIPKMWTYFPNSKKWTKVNYTYSESDLQPGDVVIYKPTSGSQHVCMYVKIDGKGHLAEANYKKKYGHITGNANRILNKSKMIKMEVYRAVS